MKIILSLTAVTLFGLTQARATTAFLITNPGFETGDTSGWTASTGPAFGNTAGSCTDAFAAQTTATGCSSGTGPAFGTYAAYTSTSFPAIANDVGEWDQYLDQNFVVPTGYTSLVLTWYDTTTWAGSGSFRGVDVGAFILQGANYIGAGAYTVNNPGSDGSTPWTQHTIDLTSSLLAYQGQTLTLRLAAFVFYDTRGGGGSSATQAIAGFDDAQITAISDAPEPSTALLSLAGIALAWLGRRRMR